MQMNRNRVINQEEKKEIDNNIMIQQNKFAAYKEMNTAPVYETKKDYSILAPILIILGIILAVVVAAILVYIKNN